MKILVIGPSITKSKGGMATMIEGLKYSEILSNNDLEFYSSYIDGNFLVRLFYSFFSYFRFKFIRKKYDIYHIHSASYGSLFRKSRYVYYLKRKRKKVILHIHGAEFMVFYNKLNDTKKNKVVSTLKKANVVVALSDGWKKTFEDAFGLINCVSIPNGIDVKKYEMCQCNIIDNRMSFISLGRLGERKGTYLLIDAVKSIIRDCPDIKVYLAGDGEIDKAKEIIKRYGLENNIFVLGWLGLEEKKKYLSLVSTLILPSYNEGLPMAILEAMAAKKVIISTNVGAISCVVNSDNGFLIDSGDVKSLAHSIKTIYNNECDCNSKSENSYKKIMSEYDTRVIHRKIEELYKKIVNE